MALTVQEQSLLDYLQNSYPRWLRSKAFEETSLAYKYDLTRVNVLLASADQRQEAVNNLFVLSSDEQWVLEWETFLKVPVDTALSLEARKANLIVRLSGNPATVKNLRNVIETFIGTEPNKYKLIELWQETPFDVDDTWTYMVDVYNPDVLVNYSEMGSILRSVHPAHCLLIMAYTYPVKDAIGFQIAQDQAIHHEFIWWEEGVARPTDAKWFWGNYIEGGYWS